MKIPFYNISRLHARHREEILRITDDVFSGGQVVEGRETQELEEWLKKISGRKHVITVNSCTDALYFSLRAAGIGKGDEVIVPALSFIATASPVIRTGATPVFADVMPDGNLDLEDARKRITPSTKAFIVVHLYGRMSDPEGLQRFAKKTGLVMIEDAAQALGSYYNRIKAGRIGLYGCISFDPSKIIGAFGTGGAVLTNDEESAKKIRIWRAQGKNPDNGLFTETGYNSRLSTLQAALLVMQMKKIKHIVAERNRVAFEYHRQLYKLPLEIMPAPGGKSCWNYHKYPVATPLRDELKAFLAEKGIETQIHYPYLLSDQPLFGSHTEDFPVARHISQQTLSLPIYPELTAEEINYVCLAIHEFFKKQSI